ncbi:MAG TPA: hypothetical protein VHE35_08230 [Kofleriaceae bacterium]|nr:hypothetical protein [Kofleriaceae bacterium]
MRAAVALAAALGLGGGAAAGVLAGCGTDVDPDGDGQDAAVAPDPLEILTPAAPGSLDDLHQRIIAPRCSGQPGLCHNGQFEPNLSTPALTYEYLVNRPSIEAPDKLRVKMGDPAASFFVDKLRGRGVATRMPLGADPLPEPDLAAIEAWISAGALRAPGAAPAPVLNNPPQRPEIGIFDAGGNRLDLTGPVQVAHGATITLRHSVRDFETPDADIPYGLFALQLADGRQVILRPGEQSGANIGLTTYDPDGPMGVKDALNFELAWTVPDPVPVIDNQTNLRSTVPAAGLVLTPIALYRDNGTPQIYAIEISTRTITLE